MMRIPRFNYEESGKKVIFLDTKIIDLANLGLISARAFNVCLQHKILIVSDLQKIGDQVEDFISLRRCGMKTALELHGLLKYAQSSYTLEDANNDSFEKCPAHIHDIFTIWFDSIKSNSDDQFNNFLTEFLPSAGKIYDLLLKNPSYFLKDKKYGSINNAKLKSQYRCWVINTLIELRDLIQKSKEIDDNTCKIISNIAALRLCLKEDFCIEYFRYCISEESKSFLISNLEYLINRAPTLAKTLFLSKIKDVERLLSYLNFNFSQFLESFVNKKKSAICFFNSVLLPFRESYNNITADNVDNLEISIKYKFPFLKESEIKFVKAFFSSHKHYPMFYISKALIINSKQREYDILCMKYGLGKYTPHKLDQIASSYSLSRERIRQILSKPILNKNKMFQSVEWMPYFKLGNIFITEKSDYFKNINEEEKLSISFEVFAFIFTSVFKYDYCDRDFGYLVDHNYTETIQDIVEQMIELKNQTYSKEVSFTLEEVLPKRYAEDKYLCHLIYTEICPHLDIETKDNKLFVGQNYIDVSSEVYNYLYSCGEPKHIADIKEYLSEKFPHRSFSIASLKIKMRENPSILPVGKTSKYKLQHWRNIYGGSIRNLIRDILNESETPLPLDVIADKVTDIYDSTNKKNIHSSMTSSEDFIPYSGGLWGLQSKIYSPEFITVDLSRTRNSFEKRFEQYKTFVEEFYRLPYLSGIEEEESLKRWQTNVLNNSLDVSDDQIKILKEYMKSKKFLPQNGIEVKFYKVCKEYMTFVEENYELPKHPSHLFSWFKKNLVRYHQYEDNRKRFFEKLLQELNSYGFYF